MIVGRSHSCVGPIDCCSRYPSAIPKILLLRVETVCPCVSGSTTDLCGTACLVATFPSPPPALESYAISPTAVRPVQMLDVQKNA